MDHISIPILDAARSKGFYEAVLEPLGWHCSGWRDGVYVGFKKRGAPALYMHVTDTVVTNHVAFKASSEDDVKAFHAAGLAPGGMDNGQPGPRPNYGPEYYAAFVLDPDGHNIEAVLGGVG